MARIGRLILAAILIPGTSLCAQDKPLGDIARETRAQKAQAPRAAKVITNDDGNPSSPVAATDDPRSVVNKARLALLRDPNHSCRLHSTGNSGPGWSDDRTAEVAFGDQLHITVNNPGSNPAHGEWIFIGKDGYHRIGNAPCRK
jgi:hypothetical protein